MATTAFPTPVSSTPNNGPTTNAATNVTGPTKGQVFDVILHDVITFGAVAASIFVKNPQSQAKAATIIQALGPLLQMLDPQIESLK